MVLQIYMARDGLARFCTVPYQHPNNRNIHSAYMHLTNYSLNKRSSNYLHTESEVIAADAVVVSYLAVRPSFYSCFTSLVNTIFRKRVMC